MKIYCLEDFKTAFEKLKSKNPYRNLESQIINPPQASHFALLTFPPAFKAKRSD